MKLLIIIFQILVGFVFIVSGFVKSVDPIGTAYKFTDYFNAFGMEGLSPLSFTLAVILSSLEFSIGVALIFTIRVKIISLIALVFIVFFSILTFILALTDAVSDCGCFGDAVKLSNWETFWKNIILLIFILLIFIQKNKVTAFLNLKTQNTIIAAATILILYFTYYNYHHLPIIDFRPYKIETSITEAMKIPKDAPQDEYETILIYSKATNGDTITKEFTLQDLQADDSTWYSYPENDSTWFFVNSKSILIKKGYDPPIKDFSIYSSKTGKDLTHTFLNNENYNFILISYDISKYRQTKQQKINNLINYSIINNISFIGLTSSPSLEIREYKRNVNTLFNFYSSDETVLKTIVRSNPGLLLLKKGVIINKWHYNDIPSNAKLKKLYGI